MGGSEDTAIDSLDYQQAKSMLMAGRPETIKQMADSWDTVQRQLGDLDSKLHQQLNDLKDGWDGKASEVFIERVTKLQQTAKAASECAQKTRDGLMHAYEQLKDIQGRIPAPTSPYSTGQVTVVTNPEQEQRQAEQDAQKVRALVREMNSDYDTALIQIPANAPEYKGPPPLMDIGRGQRERITEETTAGSNSGGGGTVSSGGGGGTVGGGGGGGTVSGGSRAGVMSASVGGGGTVGDVPGGGGTVGGAPPPPPGLVEPGPGDLPGDDGDTDLAGGGLTGVGGGTVGGTVPGGGAGGAGGTGAGGGVLGRGGGVVGGAAAAGGTAARSRGGGRVSSSAGGTASGTVSSGGAVGGAGGAGAHGSGGTSGTAGGGNAGGRAAGGRMMPMGGMGGAGGAAGEGGAKRKGWLVETDEVWDDGDDFVAPAVLGGTAQNVGVDTDEYKPPRDTPNSESSEEEGSGGGYVV